MSDTTPYTVLHPRTFSTESLALEKFALDILMGMSGEQRSIPSQYFYDATGSELFAEITRQPEYYPTRCELEILERHGSDIVQLLGKEPVTIVELGAGDGHKSLVLLRFLIDELAGVRYVPVDISEEAIEGLVTRVGDAFPGLECHGLVGEYFDGFRWLGRERSGRKLVTFLGSNIGNFNRPRALVFLRTLWNALEAGDLVLIGFDMRKDIDVMLAAYNDAGGATERFNLNLLERINRELDGRFDTSKFEHFGTYNVFTGAMESYLLSRVEQEVYIGALGKSFRLRPYEPIHLEYSFKFLPSDIEELADEAGFKPIAAYTDDKGYFTDAVWRVVKE